jgi:DNA-binding MarR family transcriptional regulator
MFKIVPEVDDVHGVALNDVLVAFTRLRRENDLLVAAIARRHAMHAPDFRALEFVRHTPDATPRSLAEYLAHSLSATTTMIDRLVAAGYARRSPNPEDGRSVHLALTPAGIQAVDEATALYRAAFEASLPLTGRDEVAATFIHMADALAGIDVERHHPTKV